ncbi:MAG: Mur ligase family protein [Anaerolineae bacterium]|nr:Mur ligase family protein [Anaerolineae bacterium]MDQ7036670.1 Mur ligase family protein [Anaerolineae bacterium]
MLNYQQCKDLLFESYNQAGAKRHGYDSDTRDLDITRWLFAEAHLPFSFVPTVTVTGSKGKGSTAILCAAILQGAQHRVGLLTSPNFLSHRERIRVNGVSISEEDFVRIINHLAPTIRRIISDLALGKYISPTGLFLAIAVQYFLEEEITALVLEVGRGGRFDEVSLIENGVACFTPIMAEHLDKIGPEIENVAWHKAGIIKADSTVVCGRQPDIVKEILHDEITKQGATIYYVDETIHHLSGYHWDKQDVQVTLDFMQTEKVFRLHTPASYQAQNIALAYAAAAALDPSAAYIEPHIIQRTRLPGRCDMIRRNPTVFVDGAINRQSAHAFLHSVLPLLSYPAVLITALPHDKEHEGVLDELMPHMDMTIVTQVSAKHLIFNHTVLDYARSRADAVMDEPDVQRAFHAGLDYVQERGTLWVVGTQSLVRDAIRFWDIGMDWLIVPTS